MLIIIKFNSIVISFIQLKYDWVLHTFIQFTHYLAQSTIVLISFKFWLYFRAPTFIIYTPLIMCHYFVFYSTIVICNSRIVKQRYWIRNKLFWSIFWRMVSFIFTKYLIILYNKHTYCRILSNSKISPKVLVSLL